MSITLSDSAAARVNTFLANRGKGFGLRLGVRTGPDDLAAAYFPGDRFYRN